jgi:uncharacterized protein YndB with AHSA1/START domain
MGQDELDRAIRGEVVVDGDVKSAWAAWTTEEGITSFFAPACNLELRVGGPFEIFFDPAGDPGERGAEGMRIMAIQPEKMLAFDWSAPPHLPEARAQRTHVVIRFKKVSEGKTKVTLFHDGWGEGGQWDEAFDYFTQAWLNVVLPRLKWRFEKGPVDWNDPPRCG